MTLPTAGCLVRRDPLTGHDGRIGEHLLVLTPRPQRESLSNGPATVTITINPDGSTTGTALPAVRWRRSDSDRDSGVRPGTLHTGLGRHRHRGTTRMVPGPPPRGGLMAVPGPGMAHADVDPEGGPRRATLVRSRHNRGATRRRRCRPFTIRDAIILVGASAAELALARRIFGDAQVMPRSPMRVARPIACFLLAWTLAFIPLRLRGAATTAPPAMG